MTDGIAPEFERMLQRALTPVEPPAELSVRLERTLTDLTDLAAEELEAWELSAMRDPRNWPTVARPVAAVTIGGVAGAALVVLRVRGGRKARRADAANPFDYADRTLRAAADEARRLLDR